LRKDYGTFQLFSGNSGQQTAGLLERTVAYCYDVMLVQGLGIVLPLAGVCAAGVLGEYMSSGGRQARKGYSQSSRRSAAMQSKGKEKKKGHFVESPAEAGEGRGVGVDSDAASQYPNSAIDLKESRAHMPAVLMATLSFYFVVFHSLSNLPLDNPLLYGVHQRFWMQPSVILFAMGGIGFNTVMKKISEAIGKSSPLSSASVSHVFLLLSVVLCTSQAHKWFSHADQSEAFYFRDYAKALVDPLPPSSILIINYDMQW
jgi:hypothetical protein